MGDTRERSFALVKKKLKSLSRRSARILDGSLMGDEQYSHAQIMSAEAILKLNAMFDLQNKEEQQEEVLERVLI